MTPSTEKCKDKPLNLSLIGLIYKHCQLCDVPLNNWQQQIPPPPWGQKQLPFPPWQGFHGWLRWNVIILESVF